MLLDDEIPSTIDNDTGREVWATLCKVREDAVREFAHLFPNEYQGGLSSLGLDSKQLPTKTYLNHRLEGTGWSVVWGNKVGTAEFFSALSRRSFVITDYCRDIANIKRSPYPDFIHDVWGHLPFLFDENTRRAMEQIAQAYCDEPITETDRFIDREISAFAKEKLSKADLEAKKQELIKLPASRRRLLNRLFLFVVEFGVLKDTDGFKIIGGGIASSNGEIENLISLQDSIEPLTMAVLQREEYNLHQTQSKIFSISQWETVFELIDEIRRL